MQKQFKNKFNKKQMSKSENICKWNWNHQIINN